MAPKLSLTKAQSWMQNVIVHPGTDEQAVRSKAAQAFVPVINFPSVIKPSKTLTSLERMGIYRMMYVSRLQDALEVDYPGLLHYLGRKRFAQLVAGYIRRRPSRSYTLNRLGDHMPQYIRKSTGLPRREFLYELAQLELAMSQVFDAEELTPLTPEAIAQVPVEAWEGARLRPIAALRVLAFRYPVNRYLEAVREQQPRPSTRRKDSWVVVFRHNYGLRRFDLSRPAYDLLKALVSGTALGQSLASVLSNKKYAIGEIQLFSWFRSWVAEGLFHSVEVSDS